MAFQKVDEIMAMENTSTEPISIFLQILGVKDNPVFQCLNLRQDTCKHNIVACRERDK